MSQTVYFSNPTIINNLYQSNNWSRGQPVSIELINTINSWTMTGPLPVSQGPRQPVNIYKLVYYSTDVTSSNVDRNSATIFVPHNISTGTIITFAPGLEWSNCEYRPGWEYFAPLGTSDYALWEYLGYTYGPLAPAARGTPDWLGGASNSSFPSNYLLNLASLGNIVLQTDSIAYGVSLNTVSYTYFNYIYPVVDGIRALRTSILNNPGIFNNFSFPSILPLEFLGWSNGSVFAPGIINEFQPGVSPTLPSTESSNYTFVRCSMGDPAYSYATANFIEQFNVYVQTPLTILLLSTIFQGYNNTSQIWRPSALRDIQPLFQNADFVKFENFIDKFTQSLSYNFVNHPPESTGVNYYIPPSSTGIDLRQLFNFQSLNDTIDTFKINHGWSNFYRPLEKLSTIPISMVYSTNDPICVIPGVVDLMPYLDPYMSTGDLSPADTPYPGFPEGYLYYFTGAQKSVIVSSFTNTGAEDLITTHTLVSNVINSTTSSIYNRIQVNNDLGPETWGNHEGMWYQVSNIWFKLLGGW